MNQVASAELIPAHAGPSNASLALKIDKPSDRQVIEKVLGWLNQAKVIGYDRDPFISLGGSPTDFVIRLQSGDTLSIRDAIGTSKPQKIGNSVRMHSTR